jgi:hypothetical protein
MKTNPEKFLDNGFIVLKKAVNPEIAKLITLYSLFDEMQNLSLERGDSPQIHNSHSSYADPMMEALLVYMHKAMEENTGLTLYPTYSYYRVYRPGAELKIHKDRPSCEISTTMMLGSDYKEQSDSYEWPIFMDGKKVSMSPGDMVIYRGCDLSHWREVFTAPEGSYHSQVFLHYVDANGPYPEYKWDKRLGVGVNPFPRIGAPTNTPLPPPKPYISYTG